MDLTKKLDNREAVDNINAICDGIKSFVAKNPGSALELLVVLHSEVLESLSSDDFFGTEGWERGLGFK